MDLQDPLPAEPHDGSPIATLFGECAKLLDKLVSTADSQDKVWTTASVTFESHASKLRAWGNETGGSTWALDHTLRKASRLGQHVFLLLETLKSNLQRALDTIQLSLRHDAITTSSGASSRATPSTKRIPDSSLSTTHLTIEGFENSVEIAIENTTETLLCLIALVPVLLDPSPQDTYREDAATKEELRDIDLAMFMFPKAPPKLITRLGRANWKRRQFQRRLAQRRTQQSAPTLDKVIPVSITDDTRAGPTIAVSREVKESKLKSIYTEQGISRRGTAFSGGSSASGILSNPDTIFSKAKHFDGYSRNSTILSEQRFTGTLRSYVLPNPPVDLLSEQEFVCPYCLQKMVIGDDIVWTEDWKDHVFRDLEPYMCTFEDCVRADRMFGLRDDWFRHELDEHRVINVWFCQTCLEEFDDSRTLENHLREVHGSALSSPQLSFLVSMCERKSQARILNQPCALCRFVCSDEGELKSHVAIHFEQLSLTSINNEDELDDDLALSKLDGNSPENELKKERLETFLNELRENAFAQKHEQGDEENDLSSDSAFGPLEGTSEAVPIDHGEERMTQPNPATATHQRTSKLKVQTFRAKVEQYLEEQAKVFEDDPESEIASVQSYDIKSESIYSRKEIFRSIRTLPPPRNQAFVGRERDIKKLHEELQTGRICVLSGTGGIGKSATAVEYTYKFEQKYAYIFWVQAETPVSCADSFGNIAAHLGLIGEENLQDQERLIIVAREFLKSSRERWLLVFDNVDSMAELRHFLPFDLLATRGSILITTRNSSLEPLNIKHSQVELDILAMDDCRRLLLTSTGESPRDMKTHPEYKLAGDIASYAGRLPLALSHIAGYIQQSGCSLEDFVELWEERLRHTTFHAPTKDGAILSPTEKTLEIVWNIGLREVTIDARELLHILAFLDSDTIQKDLLVDEHHELSLEFLHSSEKFRYKRMTSELARRRLIAIKTENGSEILSVHRALQLKILKDLNKDIQNREKVFRQAFMLVRKKFPTPSPIQIPEPDKWPVYIKYVPHVLALRKVFTESAITIAPSADFARLLSDGGMSLWERARTKESLQLLLSAESVLGQLKCDEDMLKADIDVIVGILIQSEGISRLPESLRRFKEALHTRLEYQKATPPERFTKNHEILVFNAWSDYGAALLEYNDHVQAEPIFYRCLKKYREWGSEEEIPYEYAKYYHNMSQCSMYRRDFDSAIKLAELGVKYIIMATGQSPSTNTWKFNHASILLQSGNTAKSLDMHKEILDSRIQQHGISSYETSQSYYAAGAIYAMTGELAEAETYIRNSLGSEHPRHETYPEVAIARAEFHLSQILRQQEKDLDEAEELARGAREVLNRLLPLNPLDGVPEKHELALFDHLQPLYGGARFTGRVLLQYVCKDLGSVRVSSDTEESSGTISATLLIQSPTASFQIKAGKTEFTTG